MDLKKIGKYIQTKRKELGLTQADLAEKLGMSNKSVSKWERGVCLPDVSIYMELCEILGVSLNEFIAGEDLSEEKIIEKSEENLVKVTKDWLRKRAKLKSIIISLSLVVSMIVGIAIYYALPMLFPKINYVEPMESNSKEVELAKTWFGVGKAFLYNYAIDDTYTKVDIKISLYKYGELVQKETVVEIPLDKLQREGFIAVFHDHLDKDAKIMVGGENVTGAIVGPIFDEVEEAIYGSSSQGRETEADIEHGKEIGIGCVHFGESIVTSYSPEQIENGEFEELHNQNDYTYYLSVVFS